MTTNTTGPAHATGTILVTGGTGKTGRRVARRLRARAYDVRLGARSATPAFDWHDESTWAAALGGVEAAYLAYAPALADPAAPGVLREFGRRAVESGVRRLVLLAERGDDAAPLSEAAVRESGAAVTVVRATWFMQNFSEDFLLDGVLSGEVGFPAGDVADPFVDLEDLADVVVAALTEDGHAGETYDLTGPRLLTFAEATAEIGAALGRELRYVSVPTEAYAAGMVEHGIPPATAAFLSEMFARLLDGRGARLEDGVRRALGREPRDFADFVRDAVASGVWTGETAERVGSAR